jgi:cyclic beta-1,2-glucan synthetase
MPSAELFSIERLEQHAESLAAAQRVTPRPVAGRPLATRLRDNGRVLLAAYRAIVSATRDNYPITPAAEWLIDNFHIVQDQIREIRRDLPPRFYRELPKLAEGPLAGYPRVFGLAWAFVAHTDSRFDEQMLCRFVAAYQRVQPLLIGELWAIAITLRIVLVENLRRSAQRIVAGREARQAADLSIDRLLGMDGAEAETTTPSSQSTMPCFAAFAAQLVQRLRDQDPKTTPALLWLDQRLPPRHDRRRDRPRSIRARRIEHHGAHITTSMRLIPAVNWADLFEKISLVDAALRRQRQARWISAPATLSARRKSRRAIRHGARGHPAGPGGPAGSAGKRSGRGGRGRRGCGGRGAPARPRLSPHRQGASRLREAARLSDPAAPMARPCQ